ncbi:MAG: hypothetical protein ACNA78_10125 [Balneolaceae bacterium]
MFLIQACSGTKSLQLQNQSSPITVNGTLADWQTSGAVVDETEFANIYATRQGDNLYLYIDAKSPRFEQSVRQSGLTIFLNHSKDNRKEIGIAFPAGTFNLLREHPAQYRSFINDPEWMQQPGNQQLLQDLESSLYDRVMIVDNAGTSAANHGFVDFTQLGADGIEIAINTERRFFGLEVKVPLSGVSLFDLNSSQPIWFGMAVDPPTFRMQSQFDTTREAGMGRTDGRQARQPTSNDIRQMLGQLENWYRLDL